MSSFRKGSKVITQFDSVLIEKLEQIYEMEYDYLADQQFNFSEEQQCIVDQIGLKRKRGDAEQFKSDVFVPPRQRNQANARERDRTHSYGEEIATIEYNEVSKRNKGVNTAFTMLRTLIPTEPKNRKLSKIETLRLASSYISHLRTQLLSGSIEQPCLQFLKTTNVNNTDYNRSQVCTFCMAMKKNTKLFSRENTISSQNTEPQFYFDAAANTIVLSDNSMQKFTPSFLKSSSKSQ